MLERGREYVLWDGDCEFCRRCCDIGITLDTAGFEILPYQSLSDEELRRVGLNRHRCERELKVVTQSGRVFGGAFALNYFLWRQPKTRILVLLSLLFPAVFLIQVLGYKAVADNRVWFSKLLFPKG